MKISVRRIIVRMVIVIINDFFMFIILEGKEIIKGFWNYSKNL